MAKGDTGEKAPGPAAEQCEPKSVISAVSVPREVQILLSIGDTRVRRGDNIVLFSEEGGEGARVEKLSAHGGVVDIFARFSDPRHMGRTVRLEVHGSCGVTYLGPKPREVPADCINDGANIFHRSFQEEADARATAEAAEAVEAKNRAEAEEVKAAEAKLAEVRGKK